jgi:hypothetical protein
MYNFAAKIHLSNEKAVYSEEYTTFFYFKYVCQQTNRWLHREVFNLKRFKDSLHATNLSFTIFYET